MPYKFKDFLLSDLGTLDRGKSRHRPRYAEHLYGGPYPFIQTGDIKAAGGRVKKFSQTYSEAGLAQSRLWPAGTLCITIAANIAETALLTFPACFPDSIVGFIANEELCDARYIEYWFRAFRESVQQRSYGTVQENINLEVLRGLKLSLPSLMVQKQVVKVLSLLDDRIDVLRQTNATLESTAQALFKSWFIDFDPVLAKAEGRAPEGMDAATAALFPAELEASALGLIPKKWEVAPIGEFVEAVGGSTPDTKNPTFWEPTVHHWTSPKDLSGAASPVLLDTERKVSPAGLAKISSGLLPIGSLLMSSRAPIGYLTITQVPVAINQGYIGMPPGGRLPPQYLYFWCQANMDVIKGRANGSTFMEISKKAFRPIPALLPPQQVINTFVEFAGAVFNRLAANERQVRVLVELRDTLLPRLMSGAIKAPGAGVQVEEVLA